MLPHPNEMDSPAAPPPEKTARRFYCHCHVLIPARVYRKGAHILTRVLKLMAPVPSPELLQLELLDIRCRHCKDVVVVRLGDLLDQAP